MDAQFPGNSNSAGTPPVSPEAKPVVEAVVTATVRKRKTPLGQRIKRIFFGGDARDAAAFVARDVLLPALRDTASDAVRTGIDRVIYGDTSPRRQNPSFGGQPRFSYNRPVNQPSSNRGFSAMLPGQPPRYAPRERTPDVGEVVFTLRSDAELVLERLRDGIDAYGQVSVSDLNALTGQRSTYIDETRGWFELNRIVIQQTRDGYILQLPPVEHLR